MSRRKEIYIIIIDSLDPSLSFGESIRSTVVAANNFKKAYDLAISMGRIIQPSLGYRSALGRTNRELAFQLEDKSGSSKVTIARIKRL